MKSLIKIIVFLFLPVSSQAQQNPYWQEPSRQQADSFRKVLQQTNNDSTRMYICRELGRHYVEIERDSALYFFQQQLTLAQRLKLKLWEAEGLRGIGEVEDVSGNFPGALQNLLSAQTIVEDKETEKKIWRVSAFSKEKDPKVARLTVLANIHADIGLLYNSTGDREKALFNIFEARKIAETINDKALLTINNLQLAVIYTDRRQISLGMVHGDLNKRSDSALAYAQKALHYSNESGYKNYSPLILVMIGDAYLQKQNYDSAKKYFAAAIEAGEAKHQLAFLGLGYSSIANLLLSRGETDSSLYYARKALTLFQNLHAPQSPATYKLLSSIYKSRNNIDSAFSYLELAMAAKDSQDQSEKIKNFENIVFNEVLRVQQLEKEKIETKNKIRTFAMLSGMVVFMVIVFLLYRNNRNRQKANVKLQKQKEEIEEQKKNVEETLVELKSTQAQLIQSEKMASLGELTAGIAHEIQNPLNFVNNFSDVNKELLQELKDEIDKGNSEEVKAIADDVIENEAKINHHGKRADAIVKGMLQHSRKSSRQKEPTDINALADEYLRLSYHGLRAKDKSFNATIETNSDESIGKINIIPQDIGRVLLNLFNNAFYAVNEQKSKNLNSYEPIVSLSTKKSENSVCITVRDNGNGIPPKILDKIFQPFFTTKPTGQGTGLGLSLSYDIVKAHGGEIKVESKEGQGTAFIISLPI